MFFWPWRLYASMTMPVDFFKSSLVGVVGMLPSLCRRGLNLTVVIFDFNCELFGSVREIQPSSDLAALSRLQWVDI